MIDLLSALIEYTKRNDDIKKFTFERVYGEKIPREEIQNLPRFDLVFVSAGGPEGLKTDPIFSQRFDVWSYGSSLYEAGVLDRIAYSVLKGINRVTVGEVLIHSVALSGGPTPYVDEDTGFTAMIRSILVKADERNVE